MAYDKYQSLLPFDFDWKKPNYNRVFQSRIEMLHTIRENPACLPHLFEYYKHNIGQFITDWGCTFDPRNADVGLPKNIPFILFGKQLDWLDWLIVKWRNRQTGITQKSRDMGMSWLSIGAACAISIFYDGVGLGFGSRKQEYVDKNGDPKSLFWKARQFMEMLPPEFNGGYEPKTSAPFMRVLFPKSNSAITGEAGDGIGRGDRKSIYFVDEAAYIERPELVEASLSNTTNCRIDISSAKGMGNPFAVKVHSGKHDVFTFHWRDDPRKDEDFRPFVINSKPANWYEKMVYELDPVTLAQEVDINYAASVEGVVIPSEWVRVAIGAAEKLGLKITGETVAALDVADQGKDLNAMAIRKGIELFQLKSWSGKDSDTLYTTHKAFLFADENNCPTLFYDADGMGAFVRGDSRGINETRHQQNAKQISIQMFRGSGAVVRPNYEMVKGRKNEDFFKNYKAQSWWNLRIKFQNTWRAINGEDYDPDQLISISPKLPELSKLQMELSQPTYKPDNSGKIVIDKVPDNMKSPNLADSVMMLYAPRRAAGLFS